VTLPSLLNQVLDQKYRIERLIGEGGMGAVYRATHIGTKRPVALKVIAPRLTRSPEVLERFKREAEAAGRLIHPNVVNVTDFGFAQTADGRLAYLVMEYLDGCTLADVLEEEQRLSLEWVLDIVEQICAGLSEAHKRGIVHRDLKPQNIWLEPNRRGGHTVKILDFGIADIVGAAPAEGAGETPAVRVEELAVTPDGETQGLDATVPSPASPPSPAFVPTLTPAESGRKPREESTLDTAYLAKPASTDLTQRGQLLGTPTYMSPEQCRGEELDARSDVYSLAVIVYRMLAGRAPFGGSVTELVARHQHATPPNLARRDVPRKVAAVVMAALAKDPAQRPASVEAFAKALRANAEGLFVLARRAAAIYLEHLPLFLKLTVAVFFVPILIRAAWAISEAQPVKNVVGRAGLTALFGLAAGAADFLAVTVLCGLTAVAVLLLRVTPQRRLNAEAVLGLMRERWRLVLGAAWGLLWRMVAGFLLLGIPTLILYWRSMLFAPVVMVEGKAYKEAIARGRALNKRAVGTVVAVVLFQFVVSGMIQQLGQEFYQPSGHIGLRGGLFAAGAAFFGLYLLVFMPVLAIVKALLYMKLCQLGGEAEESAAEALAGGLFPRER
jgi:serine/threonine protein kinase